MEASGKQQEAEQVKAKLTAVRRMIAKLLKSINEVTASTAIQPFNGVLRALSIKV